MTRYQLDGGVSVADRAELRAYQEKQRAEIKEIAALREKALLQERLHDEELQRLEYSRVNERSSLSILTVTLTLTLTLNPSVT